tara:strand:- start:299 stop:886 length:588 start_codon:yes stop_codon:yes gene_type:complete
MSLTYKPAKNKTFICQGTDGYVYDLAKMFNESLKFYNKNVGISLQNKQVVEIEEAMQMMNDIMKDDSVKVIDARFPVVCTSPEQKLHYELQKIPHFDKVYLAKQCLQNSELLRKFSWAVVRQNKQKAVEAMNEFTKNISEWSEMAEELKTDGQYLQALNDLGRDYKNVTGIVDKCDRMNYWDFRHSGKKIYKFVQ